MIGGSRKVRRSSFRFDETGSFLIESSLVLPLLMLCTVLMLAIGYLAYTKAQLTLKTFEWTERTAYVWTDSHKDGKTGAFSYQELDDAYGSMLSEGLGWLFSLGSGLRQAELQLPDGTVSGSGYAAAKLQRSAAVADSGVRGTGAYINRVIEGEIRADWQHEPGSGNSPSIFMKSKKISAASAYVSNPPDMLRKVDLVRTYGTKLKQRYTSSASAEEELGSLQPAGEARPAIRSELEAKAYVQRLVGGREDKVETSYGLRHIDALDSDGIMHEAKYTVNKTDARTQILKDADLIRTGKVKGVVWHFFPLASTGKCDITASLRKELERNGIMVILHR